MRCVSQLAGTCFIACVSTVAQADWPQYRGPNLDGISNEKMLPDWPDAGPKVLWKRSVGDSLGSFAIKDGRAFFLGLDDEGESCFAISVKDGKELWSTRIGPTQQRSGGQGGNGPGSTPAIDGDNVYVYGSKLMLMCLNASDGTARWKQDIQSDFNGQANSAGAIRKWGNTCSPIVEGNLVIVQGGGEGQAFIAFDKTSGKVAWKTGTEELTHATPAIADIHGVRQVIFIVQSGLVSLDPRSGKVLWKQRYYPATAIGASPVVHENIVYCSAGYGVGGGAFEITKSGNKFESKQLWYNKGQSLNQWSTPIIKDGYIYSIHGQRNATLQCVDLKTGKVLWNGPAVGQGEVMLIDGKLIVQCAQGKLLLVDPSPDEYRELASAEPLTGQAWGWPAFSKGVFIYRTNTHAAALDLSAQ